MQVPLRRRGGHGGDLREDLHDGVEDLAATPAVQGRDREGLAQPQVPQGGGVPLLGRGVDLVGGQDHRLATAAQHAHHAGIGLGDADLGIDDQQDGVGHLHGDLGLGGHGGVEAGHVHLPAAGVDDGEAAPGPLRGVGDPVAGDTGGVLNDGLAAAQDPVDQSRLAHVGPADDGQDRQPGLDAVTGGQAAVGLQEGEVLLIELVVGQARAHGLGPQVLLGVPLGGGVGGLLHQVQDPFNGLLQGQLRGVHQGDALGRGEELGDRGVVAVAAHHLVAQGVGVDLLSGGFQVPGATSQAGLLRGGHQQAGVGVGRDDGGDVTSLGHDAGALGEGPGVPGRLETDDLALAACQLGTHLEVGGGLRDDSGDVRVADRGRYVRAVHGEGGVLGIQAHVQRHCGDGLGDGGPVLQVDPLVLAPPGGGPVHGTGVQVGQSQLGGHAPRDGGLARSAWSVDRNDDSHGALHQGPIDGHELGQASHTSARYCGSAPMSTDTGGPARRIEPVSARDDAPALGVQCLLQP